MLIELKNVSYSYDKYSHALKDFSLSVDKGEFVAVIGHNGSGKSTLARVLNALIVPQKGSVMIDGFSSSDKNSLFEIRKRVGVVFQNPDNGIIASIVEDDIAFGPENLGIEREEIKKRIDFALESVGMTEYKKSSPTHLSGGQKQRIAIAGVLALKPEVLVLDESTAMLDPKGRKEIAEVVKKLNREQGVTVILITHYMDEAVNADKVVVMEKGSIIATGTPREIFTQRQKLKEAGLEVPYSTYIAHKLAEKGVNISQTVLNEQELAEALCKLK